VHASTRIAFEYFTRFLQLEHEATRSVYPFLTLEQGKHIFLMYAAQDKDCESGKRRLMLFVCKEKDAKHTRSLEKSIVYQLSASEQLF
jgi:hypothetical protein